MAEFKTLAERTHKKEEPGFLESAAKNAWYSGKNVIGNALTTLGELGLANQQEKVLSNDKLKNAANLTFDVASKFRPDPIGTLGNLIGFGNIRDYGVEMSQNAQNAMQDVVTRPEYQSKGFLDRVTDTNYLTDPRGLTADMASGLGSSVPFILGSLGLSRFAPSVGGSLAMRLAAPMVTRGGTLGRIGSGFLQAANTKAGNIIGTTLKSTAPYAAIHSPLEAVANAGELYEDLKARGFNDEEIARLMRGSIIEEIPINFAEGLLEGNVLFGKGLGLIGKNARQRLAGNAGNMALEMLGEYYQEGAQTGNTNKFLGRPYTPVSDYLGNLATTGTPFATQDEISAAAAGAIGAIPMGAGGTVYNTVMDKDVKPDNIELYDWAKNISGNAMSDETYNNIVREAQSQGVPVQLALAVANQESRGIQDSVSPAGALGVMQLMPETAKNLGVDPYNEVENIHGGVKYLKQMLDKFNGDYELALAAYNAGPDAVTKYNGIPPYSETQNYVKSINEFLNSSPNFSGNFYEDDEEETIPSDFAEGRYWIRQNDSVSYEGAQPQTTDAMYALSKWFYEKTGKPLVVSAVTNGSHADGEHSHKNGWKIDVHDGGSGAEGALFTDDFQKGYLLDEFVKYGQSLGLGMNVESLGTGNVHIDVAVDGTQWAGELAGHNFGGYKGLKSTNRSTVAAPTSTADDGDSLIDGIIKNLLTSESNATPTFDVTQDRKLEQAIFPMFVENAKNTLEGDDAAAFLNFIEQNKMLKDDGTFKNSKGNREKLRQEYAEEISEFGQAKVDERYNQFMQNQKSADEKIRSAFEKIVQQEENEGNPDATKHRAILQNGQVGAMEQFLKNAGINFDTPVETESAQEISNSADGWQKFSPENQARLAQYLKEELESEGALDENLGIALDNGNQQAIGNALEIFREIQRNKPIQQILSADEESLSDDAKKFREKYLEMQDRIQRIENSRVNLETTMKNNESESEVVPYFEDKRQLELATKNLETARAELEKLTPPKNINRVSESEQLENEMQEHSHKIDALKSRIDDMGEPKDEKSLRRRNKLIRELKSTLDKQDAAIERYDELNDAGKIWREDAALNTNSPNELLNLLQMGIAQTENKLARVNRANRKAVSTKDTMKLKRQLSMLHSVMGAQVNPTLTISQALDGIADAQKNLSELVQQISATEENFQVAINNNDMTTATNLQAQSQQLQQQAANVYASLQSLNEQTKQAILQNAPQMLEKVYGKRGNTGTLTDDISLENTVPIDNAQPNIQTPISFTLENADASEQSNIPPAPINENVDTSEQPTPPVDNAQSNIPPTPAQVESENLQNDIDTLSEQYAQLRKMLDNEPENSNIATAINEKLVTIREQINEKQEKLDEINDVAKRWRESDGVENLDDALNFLSDAISQLENKMDKVSYDMDNAADDETRQKLADQRQKLQDRHNVLTEAVRNLDNAYKENPVFQNLIQQFNDQLNAGNFDEATKIEIQLDEKTKKFANETLTKLFGKRVKPFVPSKISQSPVQQKNSTPTVMPYDLAGSSPQVSRQEVAQSPKTSDDEVNQALAIYQSLHPQREQERAIQQANKSARQQRKTAMVQTFAPQKISKLQSELEKLKTERQKLLSEKDLYQRIGAVEKLNKSFRKLIELNKKIDEVEKEIQAESKLTPLEKAKIELQRLKKEKTDTVKAITLAQKKKDNAAELAAYQKLESLDDKIAAKEKQIAELEKSKKENSKLKSLKKAKSQLEQLNAEKRQLSLTRREALDSNDIKLVKQLDGKIETINKKIHQVATKIKQLESSAEKVDSPSAEEVQAALEFGEQKEKSSENVIEGKITKVKTDNGNEYEVRYKIVEVETVTASHNLESNGVFENKAYPAELQPRDRERVTMQTSLISMANNLAPEDLMESRNLNQGAPIVRNDGVVLNGNGRTAAIKFAYENGKAENYRQSILENAEKFGINRDTVAQMKNPVLVREIVEELSRADLQAITESETGGVKIGSSEQAKIDAKKIKESSLQLYEEGDITTAANREFVGSVLNDIANKNDMNAYTTKNGEISRDGYERVSRALFALAYGNETLIDKISESTDNNIKQITNALNSAAPKIALIQLRMKNESLHNYDLSEISNAVATINGIRNNPKMTVELWLAQDVLSEFKKPSEEHREIVKFIDAHKNSGAYLIDFLNGIANEIERQGDPNQGSLYEEIEPATFMEIIKSAEKFADEKFNERSTKGKMASLFDETPKVEQPATKTETSQENSLFDETPAETQKTSENPLRQFTDEEMGELYSVITAQSKFFGDFEMPLGNTFTNKEKEIFRQAGMAFYKTNENSGEEEEWVKLELFHDEVDRRKGRGKYAPPEVQEKERQRQEQLIAEMNARDAIKFRIEALHRLSNINSLDEVKSDFEKILGKEKFDELASLIEDAYNNYQNDIAKKISQGKQLKPIKFVKSLEKTEQKLKEVFANNENGNESPKVEENEDDYNPDEWETPFGNEDETLKKFLDSVGITIPDNKETSTDDESNQKKSASAISNDSPKKKLVNYIDDSEEAWQRALDKFDGKIDGKKVVSSSVVPFHPIQFQGAFELGAILVQRGINHFAEWSTQLIKVVGKKIEPWLSPIWTAIENIPEDSKFNEEQFTFASQHIGVLMSKGEIESYEDLVKYFEGKIGKENTNKIEPILKPAYAGIKKFFDENVKQDAKTKKIADTSDTNYLSPKDKVKQKLLPLAGKPITNKATGIVAFINVTQINKMLSNRAVEKSVNNGFSQEQHLEATENIKQLYEDAQLTKVKPDEKKKEGSQGLKSVKIFQCPTKVSGENAVAKLTVKESFQHGHRIYSIELEELNKPVELANHTEIDSSTGSKDSTQKGDVSSTRHAEESSAENITQSADEGKAELENDEKYRLENELSVKLFELTAEIENLESSIRSDEENLEQFKKFGQKSVSRTTNNSTIKAVLSKDFSNIVVTQADTSGKVALSYSIPIAEIEKATAKDDETQTLNKLVEKYFESAYKKKLRETQHGISDEMIDGATNSASERYADYHSLVVSNMREKFREYVPTENEKAERLKELEELKKRQAELNYTLQHLDEAYKATKDGKFDEFLQGATENQQEESKINVPIKFPDGRKIFDTYNKDKEFLSEGLGVFKIPRYEIIEGKVLNNARDSLKIEAERKYYDYVKETLDAINSFAPEIQTTSAENQETANNKSEIENNSTKTELHFEVGTHTHTRTGAEIPKAKLKTKVDREEYLKLNALAKKYGGSYSKYAKAFLFKTENDRDNFVKDASQMFGGQNQQEKISSVNNEVDERLKWINENKFIYDENKSVDENMEVAEKLAQEYLDKFGITANINTPERIALRRQIIEELYGNGAKNKERKAFLVMGLPASGKSTIAETVANENGALIIDSDMVKEKLPEFNGGLLANAVHDESTFIANRILDSALLNGDNVVLPIVGSFENDVQEKIQRLKAEGYEVNLYHVTLPLDKTLERAKNRFKETGRLVSTTYIKSVGLNPKNNYDKLKNTEGVNNYAEWSNEVDRGQRPRLLERSEREQDAESGLEFGRTRQSQGLDEGNRTSSESATENAESIEKINRQEETTTTNIKKWEDLSEDEQRKRLSINYEDLQVDDSLQEKLFAAYPSIKEWIKIIVEQGKGVDTALSRQDRAIWKNAREDMVQLLKNESLYNPDQVYVFAAVEMFHNWKTLKIYKPSKPSQKSERLQEQAEEILSQLKEEKISPQESYNKILGLLYNKKENQQEEISSANDESAQVQTEINPFDESTQIPKEYQTKAYKKAYADMQAAWNSYLNGKLDIVELTRKADKIYNDFHNVKQSKKVSYSASVAMDESLKNIWNKFEDEEYVSKVLPEKRKLSVEQRVNEVLENARLDGKTAPESDLYIEENGNIVKIYSPSRTYISRVIDDLKSIPKYYRKELIQEEDGSYRIDFSDKSDEDIFVKAAKIYLNNTELAEKSKAKHDAAQNVNIENITDPLEREAYEILNAANVKPDSYLEPFGLYVEIGGTREHKLDRSTKLETVTLKNNEDREKTLKKNGTTGILYFGLKPNEKALDAIVDTINDRPSTNLKVQRRGREEFVCQKDDAPLLKKVLELYIGIANENQQEEISSANDEIEKLAHEALKAEGLEGKKAPEGNFASFYKSGSDYVVEIVTQKDKLDSAVKRTATNLSKYFYSKGHYDSFYVSQPDRHYYYFENIIDAQAFQKALQIYFDSENAKATVTDKNVESEQRVREALKVAGIEEKTTLEGYTFWRNRNAIVIERNNDEKISSPVLEKVIALAEFFNGKRIEFANPAFEFANFSDQRDFRKALKIYFGKKGENSNESRELGQSRSVDGRHKNVESEVRAGTDKTARQRRDTSSEENIGQQRQDEVETSTDDTTTNAENERPVPVQSAGTSSAGVSAGNGLRGDTAVIQSTNGDERGSNGISSNVESIEFAGQNFHITDDSGIGEGGLKTKFQQNVDAIKLLKQLESENRKATPSEQEILSKFNGWGTLASAFTNTAEWQKQAEQLKEILTEDEYKSARTVVNNAFYTHPKIASAMWKMLERLGFKGGRILDPAMGSGIFFGTMPVEVMARSELTGVEYDSLSGRIAQQLYQKAAIDIMPYQERLMPNNYYDLAITNVPFEQTRILSDKQYSKQGYMLHNYYFAKTIDKVRPGGLIVFITSQGTMQAQDEQAKRLRAELNGKADLIAAFKLPSQTFEKNAGTQVTSDILILQKRFDPTQPSEYAQSWKELGDISVETPDQFGSGSHPVPFGVNEYFVSHLENMIGTPTADWHNNLSLDGKGLDVANELSKLIENLPENIYTPIQRDAQDTLKNTFAAMTDASQREGSFSVKDGKAVQKLDGILVEVPTANQEIIKDFVTLEKSLDNILKAQLSPETTNEKLSQLRETLNKNYDDFIKKYGYLNAPKNLKILGADPNYGKVAAIEKYKEDKQNKTVSASKADIFYKRTASPLQVVNSTDNALDAMRLSLSRRGGIDMDYMTKLTGKTPAELEKELGDLVYKNPKTNLLETADEYLSGNVREKLQFAREAAKLNPEFNRNVEALEKVMPVDLTEDEIFPHMGANWIDEKYYYEFVEHLIGETKNLEILRDPYTGKWIVKGVIPYEKNVQWRVMYGASEKASFLDLFEGALNHHYPSKWTSKNVVLKEQMAEARDKIDKILEEFAKWIYADEERKADLLKTYNEKFNSEVERVYDGSHLELPSLNDEVKNILTKKTSLC